MSEIPAGTSFKDDTVKIKIIKPRPDTPMCWYNELVGQTMEATRRTWVENGKVTNISHIVAKTPGGFNGSVHPDDLEEIK